MIRIKLNYFIYLFNVYLYFQLNWFCICCICSSSLDRILESPKWAFLYRNLNLYITFILKWIKFNFNYLQLLFSAHFQFRMISVVKCSFILIGKRIQNWKKINEKLIRNIKIDECFIVDTLKLKKFPEDNGETKKNVR